MDDNSIMPFGPYKGEKMANVPAKYLLWLRAEKQDFGKLEEYITDNLDVLKLEEKRDQLTRGEGGDQGSSIRDRG